MRRMRRSSVLLALLLLIPNTQGAVTCKASTTIKQTTVTCYFGMDISRSNHNFNVQYYSPHSQANPESVLMCNWKTNTEMACKKSSDVTFDHVISDQITLHRWPSVGNWGSRYVCQLVPSTGDILDPCELTFSEIKATAPRVNTTTTSSSLLENVYQSQREVRTLSIVAMVISCILLIVIVVVFCRHRIKERIADWRKSKRKENCIEEDAVELAPPPPVKPQVREEAEVIDTASSTEEKKRSRVSRLFSGKKKEKTRTPEDAETPMFMNSVQTALTSQRIPLQGSSISTGSTKKESRPFGEVRDKYEKLEAELRKQIEEAEQRKRREEEEQKQREQAKQAEVTEKKSDKKKKK